MKKLIFNIAMLALFAAGISSCSSESITTAGGDAAVLENAEGIIPLTEGIGDWDAAYLTKQGYFLQKNDLVSESRASSKYATIAYMSADQSEKISLITAKESHLPTQLVANGGILYFSFPNDTILELVYDNGHDVSMLDSIPYSKEELLGIINNSDSFKSYLSVASTLLKENTNNTIGGAIASKYGDLFGEVSNLDYSSDTEGIADKITTSESGDYKFAEIVSNWYDEEVELAVTNTISLWTGNASFKVGGSSCTLSATIWCPVGEYNQYGTYGIICDPNVDKLYLGQAEYEDYGFQSVDDLSYSVDIRGLKPNTTYYYRAFYRFNSSDHGNIIPKYGDPTDQVLYDTTIKSFTTGDNILTVDVVMCIDVTGSMSDIINTVKRNAIGFYDSFKNACDEEGIQLSGLNAQVIAFRDLNVDSEWLKTSETYSLPAQREDFNNFVNGLRASGGGDTPESGLEALSAAFDKSDWGKDDGYHRQVIICWTDADYLVGSYAQLTADDLRAKWNAMPSGKRLILFAPYGTYGSNGGDWLALDSWKNVIHEADLYSGFNNFDYILKSIIGELTSRSSKAAPAKKAQRQNYFFRPNK